MPAGAVKKYSDDQIIAALHATGGLVTHAAKAMGTVPKTLYDRMARTPALKLALDEIRNGKLDFAESKLMELIAKGQPSAIIFFLKCLGKERGYVERVENTGKDGKDLNILPVIAPPRAANMEEWLEQNRKEANAA